MTRFYELINTGEQENIEMAFLIAKSQNRHKQLFSDVDYWYKKTQSKIDMLNKCRSKFYGYEKRDIEFIISMFNNHKIVINGMDLMIGKDVLANHFTAFKNIDKNPILCHLKDMLTMSFNIVLKELREDRKFISEVLSIFKKVEKELKNEK